MAGEIFHGKEPPGTRFVGPSIGPNALEKR